MGLIQKIKKSHNKIYRERAQPESRAHLGILPKKKDFKQISKLRHKIKNKEVEKEKLIQDRNPDEFYFKMLRKDKRPEDAYSEEQVKEFMTKDIKYLDTSLTMELRKIEKLRGKLTLPSKPSKLTIFVDDDNINLENIYEEVKTRDSSKNSKQFKNYSGEQIEFYQELSERLDRAKALRVQLDTLRCKYTILNKKDKKYKIIQGPTKNQAPIVKRL